MKMVIVAPPGPDLCEPCAISAGFAAQLLLDRRIDENPRHRRLARDGLEQPAVLRRPRGVDNHAACGDDVRR